MAKLYNLARMTTTTTGSDVITLGTAVAGRLDFETAGVSDGETISYGIVEGNNSEVGRGVYGGSGSTLTRSVSNSTNSGSPIVLGGSAHVFIPALANDFSQDGWISSSESWTYASADAPTYTFNTSSSNIENTYTPGMRFKCDIDGGSRYFICTGATGSTVTVYGGTDYVMSASPITNSYYSTQKAPLGFPLSPSKWTVIVTDTTLRSQVTPTSGTWYNVGSLTISVPIGAWNLNYRCLLEGYKSTSVIIRVYATLSTANNSESNTQLGSGFKSTNVDVMMSQYVETLVIVTAKTPYYLNIMSPDEGPTTIYLTNNLRPAVMRAICAYL